MNLIRNYIIAAIISFFMALLFYAIYNHWIILRTPWQVSKITNTSQIVQKKQIILHYFHGDKWKAEKQEMLWSGSIEKNIFHILNAWLALLDEEHITIKKTTLQSAVITPSGIAYLSFDHNILNKEETIFKKGLLIEGLLKTLACANVAITHAQFLVQHQLLQDAHLDFSMPWSVHGFMK